ncbi:MAG: hypothetical protein GY756_10550 [bacterium]|nr:hypothetical protein [bacterium]
MFSKLSKVVGVGILLTVLGAGLTTAVYAADVSSTANQTSNCSKVVNTDQKSNCDVQKNKMKKDCNMKQKNCEKMTKEQCEKMKKECKQMNESKKNDAQKTS